jgi:hypothetical protein
LRLQQAASKPHATIDNRRAVHSSNGDVPANGRMGRPPRPSEASAGELKLNAAAAAAVGPDAFTTRPHIPLSGCVNTGCSPRRPGACWKSCLRNSPKLFFVLMGGVAPRFVCLRGCEYPPLLPTELWGRPTFRQIMERRNGNVQNVQRRLAADLDHAALLFEDAAAEDGVDASCERCVFSVDGGSHSARRRLFFATAG